MTSTGDPPSAGATNGRAPDFFIVGSPKTGTTSLYRMLRSHPQIYMPDLKEPRYLASDMRARFQRPTEAAYPQTIEQYLALFDDATPQQRAGEATTFYLVSKTAAANIAELTPDARVVAILREPVSFLRSLHLMFQQWRVESEQDLRKAMSLEGARRENRHIPRLSHLPQLLQYADHVRYVEQLRRYHAHLPPENVLALVYDDFSRDNQATVRRVLQLLDVDDQHDLDVMHVNVTKSTVRSWKVKDMVDSLSKGQGALSQVSKTAVKALTTRRVRHGAIQTLDKRVVSAAPAPLEDSFVAELRERFKPEVVALSEFLDRDLVELWGYRDVP